MSSDKRKLVLSNLPESGVTAEAIRSLFEGDCRIREIQQAGQDEWTVEFETEEDCINGALQLVGKKLNDRPVRARTADKAKAGYAMALPSKEMSAAARALQQQQMQAHPEVPLEWRVPPSSFPAFGYAPFEAVPASADSRPRKKGGNNRRGRRDERGGRAGHFESAPAPLPLPVSPTLTGASGAPSQSGYTTDYIHYTREQIADILDRMQAPGSTSMYRPATLPPATECVAVRVTPDAAHNLRDPQPIIFPASPSPALAAQPAIGASLPFLDLNMSTGLSGLDLGAAADAAAAHAASANAANASVPAIANSSAAAAPSTDGSGVFAKPAPPQRSKTASKGKAGVSAPNSWAAKASQAPKAPAAAPAATPAAKKEGAPAKKSWKPKQSGSNAPAQSSAAAAPASAAPAPVPAAGSTWAAKLAASNKSAVVPASAPAATVAAASSASA